MVERFFCTSGATTTNTTTGGPAAGKSDCGGSNFESGQITLLSGPPSCGKTSLLFQFALNSIATCEGYVVFICNRRRLEANPPFLSQTVDPSSDIFQRIQIKYVDDDEGIKKYFAAFHLLYPSPIAVIIDDFGDFFDESKCQQRYNNARGRDLAMVRVLALSQNAIIHANKKASCKLLLSDTHHGDSPRLVFIYKRWISSIFIIEGDGSSSFVLKHSTSVKGNVIEKRTARYSIALHYLVLERIAEDAQLMLVEWN